MAFFKTLLLAAFIAAAAAQVDITQIQGQTQQLGQIQNATSGVTGGQELPVNAEQLPAGQEQAGQLTGGSGDNNDSSTESSSQQQQPIDITQIQGQTQQIGQLQNATSGVTGGQEMPAAPVSEGPSTEAPSRFSQGFSGISNGINGIRGNRRHH